MQTSWATFTAGVAPLSRRLSTPRRPCLPSQRDPALRVPSCRRLVAQQGDREEALTGKGAGVHGAPRSDEFRALASKVAGSLAAEFASNEGGVYDKLERWLVGSHDEEGELPPRSDQTTEESDAKRLMRQAAETFGMPTTLTDAVASVQNWLANPSHAEESHDSQMVARLLHRLLQAYERSTGEDFEGQDEQQYDKLHGIATRVLGSSLSKDVLKSLVRSYLGV